MEKDINKNIYPKGYQSKSFDQIKEEMVNASKQFEQIKDFDYDASNVNALMSMFAYIGTNMQFMANMGIIEGNLDTAKTEKAIKAQSQGNGYVLNGISSSKITINLECSMRNDEPVMRIPRGTKFIGSKVDGGETFPFVTTQDINSSISEGGTYFPEVELAQGMLMRNETRFKYGVPILIKDTDIDRKSIKVWVDGVEWINWTQNNIVDVNGGSRVFYVMENFDGDTRIYFGEGTQNNYESSKLTPDYIGGLKPMENSTIVIEFLRTKGRSANGCRNFVYADTIKDMEVNRIITNYDEDPYFIGSMGGGEREDKESIRENGKRAQESQRRMVTTSDWLLVLDKEFKSMIQTRQVYYPNEGKNVYISIKPLGTLTLTSNQKQDIVEVLNKQTIGKFVPIVINPIYLFVKHKFDVSYNPIELNESRDWLDTKIRENIFEYYKKYIEIFDNRLHKSKLLTKIDDSDRSIKGSSGTLSLVREVSNYYQTTYKGIQFFNEVKQGGLRSSNTVYVGRDVDPITLRKKTYEINIQSALRVGGKSVIVAGPFVEGDVDPSVPIYTNDDIIREEFENVNEEIQKLYYEIGVADHENDSYEWSFGKIRLTEANFAEPYMEIEVDLVNDNTIYSGDGALMIYEKDIRPQYLTIDYDIAKR